MNASKYIASTLLMSCLMLPSFAVAQNESDPQEETQGQIAQKPAEDIAEAETEADDSCYAVCESDREAEGREEERKLDISIHLGNGTLRVDGGIPGARFVLVAGPEETRHTLPGGAELRGVPLAVWGPGKSDADGSFAMALEYNRAEGDDIQPPDLLVQVLVQVLVLVEDGMWHSSHLMTMHFDGESLSESIVLAQAAIELPTSVDTIRPEMLAQGGPATPHSPGS